MPDETVGDGISRDPAESPMKEDENNIAVCQVEVYVDAWIPQHRLILNGWDLNALAGILKSPTAAHHYHAFEGDNRDAPARGGSFRMRSVMLIDVCGDGADPVINAVHQASPSTGYWYDYEKVASVPWWPDRYRLVERSETATASNDRMTHSGKRTGPCAVRINIDAAAANPLIPSKWYAPFFLEAPDIDYSLTLDLECRKTEDDEDALLSYRLRAQHDGFPAYSVFIHRKLIYSHLPKTDNQSIFSLFGSGEYSIRRSNSFWLKR